MTWVALAAGCAGAPGADASRYAMRGQLVVVQLDTGQVLLKHDAIPGYMDAMTMLFRVADRAAIRDRRPGDLVTATLVVESDASYLEDMLLTGTAPLDDAAPTRPVADGLHLKELCIQAPCGHEMLVCASLDDFPAAKHDDPIGHAHGRKAM